MQFCKIHKANPPMLNCNECFPIDGAIEPASNEEIEHHIKAAMVCNSTVYQNPDESARLNYEKGIRFGLAISSELKAQKPEGYKITAAEGFNILKAQSDPSPFHVPVDESLESSAVKHANTVSDPELAEWHARYSSFKAGHSHGEAKGIATGWRQAINYLVSLNAGIYGDGEYALREEAKRRGIKLSLTEEGIKLGILPKSDETKGEKNV